jgi:hypothetical protein
MSRADIAKAQSPSFNPWLKSQGSIPKAQARSESSMRSPSGSSTET